MATHVRLEPLPAVAQRQAADVLAAVPEQIENKEGGGLGRVETLDVARAEDVNAALQLLKSGRPARRIQRNDLSIDEQGRRQLTGERLEGADDGGKLGGFLVAEARPEADVELPPSRRHLDQRPDAVVLRLEDQSLSGQGRL